MYTGAAAGAGAGAGADVLCDAPHAVHLFDASSTAPLQYSQERIFDLTLCQCQPLNVAGAQL